MPQYETLNRDEVVSVINGRAITRRVPVYIHLWVHADQFGDRKDAVLDILRRYPCDIQHVGMNFPATCRGEHPMDPNYSWLPFEFPKGEQVNAIDARAALQNWDRIDEIVENFPQGDYGGLWHWAPEKPDGRYRLAHWWFCLFERHWSLRGMTNALMDYYTNPREVHRLFEALTRYYCGVIERAATEQRCDGVWTSDDLGTQTGEFFSPAIFREFYAPYYRRMIDAAHRHGMHLWMHACGNITQFIPLWIDCGLDVLHPIQKHTMDEKEIAAKFGDKITIFAGLDVQQVIPWGTPEDVRREVRFLMDTYWRPGRGRCMITAGNGINGDCQVPALEAFFDESFAYGAKVAARNSPNAAGQARREVPAQE